MSESLWSQIDHFISPCLGYSSDEFEPGIKRALAAGLPEIQVSPSMGRFLEIMALSIKAERILEVGTLGAYSTIWLAKSLSRNGKVYSLEKDPRAVAVARANLQEAQCAHLVEVLEGDAISTLEQMKQIESKPFDLAFIDADKARIPEYFDLCLDLCRSGALIIVDNVVREGEPWNFERNDASIDGIRKFYTQVPHETRVKATIIQTVGIKGHDGICIAVKL